MLRDLHLPRREELRLAESLDVALAKLQTAQSDRAGHLGATVPGTVDPTFAHCARGCSIAGGQLWHGENRGGHTDTTKLPEPAN